MQHPASVHPDPQGAPSSGGVPGKRSSPWLSRILGSTRRSSAAEANKLLARCHDLTSEHADALGAHLAQEVATAYRCLSPAVRESFFDLLAHDYFPNPASVLKAAEEYRLNPSYSSLANLQAAVEPRRQELFRRFNMAPEGTATLVAMRQQLLPTLALHPERSAIDSDLSHLFRSWFNAGFLSLRRINWQTSAAVLERLIRYEAVHQIQGWSDLRRRLEKDRLCYGFFHQALPDEPLIFIEVALTRGLTANVRPLLDPQGPVLSPERANTAIFYSITNCQEGLRGISFGNLLIKRVVDDLGKTLPHIRTYSTLSPVPGFREWLESMVESELPGLKAVAEAAGSWDGSVSTLPKAVIRDELERLCASYLIKAKRGSQPLDSVARFHLSNGARLERLNWGGDVSEIGLKRSYGFTANYVYRLSEVERNHQSFANEHAVVASRRLVRLADSYPFRAR